jgi:hypothetical protein
MAIEFVNTAANEWTNTNAVQWIGLFLDSADTGSEIIRYFCILTGSADGTSDLTLPMKSFQARRRAGDPTYLSVVVPGVAYAADILARSNGFIRIQQAYERNKEIIQSATIIEVDFTRADLQEGGQSQSMTLTGYKNTTFYSKPVALSGVTYRATVNGKYRYRLARPYLFLNPGDTVTFADDGVSFEVDTMSYFIDANSSTVELEST